MSVYQFWVKLWPAPDLPGQWVAHCLDFDVVTQGNSLSHVMHMVHEAVSMVVGDDLNAGLDPIERRAPQEFWDEMYAALAASAKLRPLVELTSDPSFSGTVYANLEIAVSRQAEQTTQEPIGIAMVA